MLKLKNLSFPGYRIHKLKACISCDILLPRDLIHESVHVDVNITLFCAVNT